MQTHRVDTRWFQNALADKRLSQRKLASMLGLDPAAVSLMIRGRRKLSAAEAAEIARFLGVSVEEVLTRAGVGITIPKGKASMNAQRIESATSGQSPPASPAPRQTPPDMLDIPVPMSDGSTAHLTVPRVLTKADADRIAALVAAFAQP